MSKAHWLGLSTLSGIGGVTARKLLEKFGSLEAAFYAEEEELCLLPRVTSDIAHAIRELEIDALEEEIRLLDEMQITVLTWEDNAYPNNLWQASDSPPLIFLRGDVCPEDERAVAIVGTRDPTPHAAEIAGNIAESLAERKLTVISGLAMGIDTAAHKGALRATGGRTIAVLGSGICHIHPRQNANLAEEIVTRGALISDLHPRTPPKGANLMARDRIISGLSKAVIVVEAGIKSGSLDTAAKALRQNRLVLSVPGSPGTEELIAQGAQSLDPVSLDFDELADEVLGYQGPGRSQLSLWA